MRLLFYYFACLLFVSACHPAQTAAIQQPQILLLHLQVSRPEIESSVYTVSLTEAALRPGQLKTPLKPLPVRGNTLEITLMDKRKSPLRRIVVDDPLERPMEYLGTDGQLHETILRKTQGDCLVRAPFDTRFKWVAVHRRTLEHSTLLASFALNF